MTESSGCTSLVHSVSCKPLSSFSTRGLAVLVAVYTLRLQLKMKMWVQKSETPSRCSLSAGVTLKKREVSVWWDIFSVVTLPLAYACRGVGNFSVFVRNTEHRVSGSRPRTLFFPLFLFFCQRLSFGVCLVGWMTEVSRRNKTCWQFHNSDIVQPMDDYNSHGRQRKKRK